MNRFHEARQKWEDDTVRPALERSPERQETFETSSGIPIQRLYTPEDLTTVDPVDDIGLPGEYPFTRGVQPTMYRGRFWTMRQYAGFGSAEETNARYRYLLSQGQTGLSVAFDLPTQIGYDADHPLAEGEVGRTGVAISTLDDMRTLFDRIPQEQVSTSLTINATAAVLVALYAVVAEERGLSPTALSGTVQNDILKEYIARGTFIYPPKHSMRLVTDLIRYCAESMPKWNPISISGYHIREAGATAVQEAAFTLANGIAYVQATIQAGIDVDAFAPQLSFFFNAHNQFFEEVAKFRAARRLWARLMRERFGAKNPRSWLLRFHTQTGGSTLTAQQPENNIVRVALQAFASVCGGTQSLHTNGRDEALSLPTEESATIALRTQQIIAFETGAGDTVDPLAGSYFVETLTTEIETRVREYLDRIDAMGGALGAIERGFPQEEISRSAYAYQMAVEENRQPIVGVNRFVAEDDTFPVAPPLDPEIERKQIERVRTFRASRNEDAARKALEDLRNASQTPDNLMPHILEAVRRRATLGEICDTLRGVFGEYKRVERF
ncbi:MAG: methylmalonyl-CoA mutase family protein [candidate division Zixibacteria bacterium]|nr:methylmalonyl-CoA mutase family protein [candidate division Zixibacteria bacterium]